MPIVWELTVPALLSIMTYTILYKYNPAFKFVEHFYLGIYSGYIVVIGFRGFLSTGWTPMVAKGETMLVLPMLLGVLILFRLSKSLAWSSRIPMAILVGTLLGVSIRASIGAFLVQQIRVMFTYLGNKSALGIFNYALSLVIMITVLGFFVFTLGHKQVAMQRSASIGRAALMLSFGAVFAVSVMSRIAMAIGVIYKILLWLGLTAT